MTIGTIRIKAVDIIGGYEGTPRLHDHQAAFIKRFDHNPLQVSDIIQQAAKVSSVQHEFALLVATVALNELDQLIRDSALGHAGLHVFGRFGSE
ncbi:MAG TPA: hypothetical protein VJ770_22815 [Stellaceae bacterium]|nr:hypothetical protein [Stellaceae bacterium]